MEERIKHWRQQLHRIPEIGLKEYKTAQYLRQQLTLMGYAYETVLETGTLVYVDAHQSETMAFRSDIDALNIIEKNAIPFKSEHLDCMHACGHDGHMATLLGFADWLKDHKNELRYNVLLIFQPAEESPGGAGLLVKEGILEKYHVKGIFGLHLMPDIPAGKLACRSGPLMAECGELHVTVRGQSSHAGLYHQGIDTIMIASQLIGLYKSIKVTSISPLEQGLLHIGMIEGGSANNIVANKTTMHGTVRTYSDDVFKEISSQIKKINASMESIYGCQIECVCDPMYPPVLNDPTLYQQFKSIAFQDGDIELRDPLMLAEDFSFYQTKVPGIFFYVGVGTPMHHSGLHTETFNFDEKYLMRGLETYIALIQNIQL